MKSSEIFAHDMAFAMYLDGRNRAYLRKHKFFCYVFFYFRLYSSVRQLYAGSSYSTFFFLDKCKSIRFLIISEYNVGMFSRALKTTIMLIWYDDI